MRLDYDIGRADRQRTVSPITNTEYALSRLSPSLRRDPFCRRAEGLNIIYEVVAIASASTALSEKGPSAVDRPLIKGTISFAAFDDRVHGPSHFGGDCCKRFAA